MSSPPTEPPTAPPTGGASGTGPSDPDDFETPIGFLSGHWLPHDQLGLSVDDLGFRQGVTAVERLRTYGGKIFQLDAHLARWRHTTAALAISTIPVDDELRRLLEQLLEKNQAWVEREGDVGITLFATPGARHTRATLGLHLNRLDHQCNTRRRRQGQPLVITDVEQPSESCWPRSIKIRCRVHYYLADMLARQHDDDAMGVLVDHDGSVTETSIANLAIVESGRIVSPRRAQVLGGITQSVVEQLAREASIDWSEEFISRDRLRRSDEVLLMGTDTGIWFASSVDGVTVGSTTTSRVYDELRSRFESLVA